MFLLYLYPPPHIKCCPSSTSSPIAVLRPRQRHDLLASSAGSCFTNKFGHNLRITNYQVIDGSVDCLRDYRSAIFKAHLSVIRLEDERTHQGLPQHCQCTSGRLSVVYSDTAGTNDMIGGDFMTLPYKNTFTSSDEDCDE